jgi:predicted MFS family arabinose efflux permease
LARPSTVERVWEGSWVRRSRPDDLHRRARVLLFARVALSQMDVPTRQAYVMALVSPAERTAAAATTNSARYVTRPFGAVLGGLVASLAIGAPFVIAGSIKSGYDLVLWRWFRTVPLPEDIPS